MAKRVKIYGFRQLMHLSEKELKKKEYEITYKNIRIEKIIFKKAGRTQIIYRASNGRFAKKSDYARQQEIRGKHKQMPEQEDFYQKWRDRAGKGFCYRAVQAINGIPIANKYYSATLVQIDKFENTDMQELLEDLLTRLEKDLHYKRNSWTGWFNYKALLQTQEPKPYFGNERGKSYEFHKI
jgi:hypothetical protein